MTARELLSRLEGVKRSGEGWVARCPGHDDRSQSLSVSENDGKVLVHCFAGCAAEAIVTALQLTLADLFVEARAPAVTPNGGERRIVATYDYRDAAGVLLYQVVRYQPKAFVQRRPEGDGWIWSMGNVRRVLYRLDEIAEQRRVYLVEGEKDADNLWRLGLAATTTVGGAAHFRDDYADQLRDAGVDEVIILPDNDDPGRQYAAKATAALRGRSLTVKVLPLPGLAKKGDVSDWLGAGHTAEELEQLAAAVAIACDEAPSPTVSNVVPLGIGLGTFLGVVDPEPESLIEGILSDDGGGWIGGEEKLGKSFYAADEGLCLALGMPVCGKFVVPKRRRVFFLEEEDSPRRTRQRIKALLRGRGKDPDDPELRAELDRWFHLEVWSGFKFDHPPMMARLEAAIATFEPTVVYVDVLRKVTLRDLNKAAEASALLDLLDELRRRYGVIFRILHHYRKAQGFRVARGSGEIGGSFVLGAWAENSLFFEPTGRRQSAATKVEIQMKDGAPEPAFLLKMTGDGPKHAPTSMVLTAEEVKERATSEDFDEKVMQALGTAPKTEPRVGKAGVTIKDLAEALKRPETTVRRALKRMSDKDLVDVVGQAGKKLDLYEVHQK